MIDRPALAPQCAAYIAPGDGVIVLSATRDVYFEGAVFQALLAKLDGRASIGELCDALSDCATDAEVWYALRILVAEGCVVESSGAADDRIGLDAVGIPSLVTLVGVRDLLDTRLHDADSSARETRRPWMPICDTGDALWIGPRFDDAVGSACWLCLEQTILSARPAAALVRRTALARVRAEPGPILVTAEQADTIRRHVRDDDLHDAILSLDRDGRVLARHPLRRRSSCERCGTPAPARAETVRPIRVDTLVRLESDTSRESAASDFVSRHAALLDPITGIAKGVEKVPLAGCDSVHVYVGGPNRARWRGGIAALRHDLRRSAGGKGHTDMLARASLLGELAERSSGVHRGDEITLVATRRELGELAIDPNACMLFSDDQFDRAAQLSTQSDRIPQRLSDAAPIGWTPVWSLTRNVMRYLPTGYLYFDYPNAGAEPFSVADSNGNAAGATLEHAIVQGLLELVERDAVGIWWHNRIARACVPLHSLDDTWAETFAAQLESIGRDVWILDVTTDLEIPVCVAVSRRTIGDERPLLGFGAHVTRRDAARRALGELGQMMAVFDHGGGDDSRLAPPLREWIQHASTRSHPYLVPADGPGAYGETAIPPAAYDTLAWCRERIEQHGLECLVLDQTRDDIRVPVAKVIVPGLRHFRRRLAPGRLYDVPERMGWLRQAPLEHTMNEAVLPF